VHRVLVPAQVPVTPTPVSTIEADDELSPIRPVRTTKRVVKEEKGFDMPERNELGSKNDL